MYPSFACTKAVLFCCLLLSNDIEKNRHPPDSSLWLIQARVQSQITVISDCYVFSSLIVFPCNLRSSYPICPLHLVDLFKTPLKYSLSAGNCLFLPKAESRSPALTTLCSPLSVWLSLPMTVFTVVFLTFLSRDLRKT